MDVRQREHKALVSVGDRMVQINKYTGSKLVKVGNDMFARPCDLPAKFALVKETYRFAYRYPMLKAEPEWKLESVELDLRSLGEPDPEPPSWWQRLLAFVLRRERIPAAKLLKDRS